MFTLLNTYQQSHPDPTMPSDQSNIPGLFSLHKALEILNNARDDLSDEQDGPSSGVKLELK